MFIFCSGHRHGVAAKLRNWLSFDWKPAAHMHWRSCMPRGTLSQAPISADSTMRADRSSDRAVGGQRVNDPARESSRRTKERHFPYTLRVSTTNPDDAALCASRTADFAAHLG